jgi:hypothetical protein
MSSGYACSEGDPGTPATMGLGVKGDSSSFAGTSRIKFAGLVVDHLSTLSTCTPERG